MLLKIAALMGTQDMTHKANTWHCTMTTDERKTVYALRTLKAERSDVQ